MMKSNTLNYNLVIHLLKKNKKYTQFDCTQANIQTVNRAECCFTPLNKSKTLWNIFKTTIILLYSNSKMSHSSQQTSLL